MESTALGAERQSGDEGLKALVQRMEGLLAEQHRTNALLGQLTQLLSQHQGEAVPGRAPRTIPLL